MSPVVELRRARAGMVGHLRRLLQRPAVLEIRRDAGRAEAVIAELGGDPRGGGTSADHRVGVGLGQGSARQQARAAPNRPKQRPLWILGDARSVDVCGEVRLKVMVARHGVLLAALLAQPHPEAAVLREHVLDLHADRRTDPRERINHEGNQRPITKSGRGGGVDGVNQHPRLVRGQHRGLPRPHRVRRSAHRSGGVRRDHLTRHQPIEQVLQRGQLLFHRRRGKLSRLHLDPRRDVERLHPRDRRHLVVITPRQKLRRRAAVGAARVRVADVRREEFQKAHAGTVAGSSNQCGQGMGGSDLR